MPRLLHLLLGVGILLARVPATIRADAVTEWNSRALDAIRNESTSPPLAARNLAILHLAIYEAVNAIEGTHEPYLFPLTAAPGAPPEAAVVGAAYECLSGLYPSQSAAFDLGLNEFLSNTPATSNRADGLALGQLAAVSLLFWRSDDGSSTTVPYIPGVEPGDWRRTPPFFRPPELPQWPYVDPFALTHGAQFLPPGPPSLTSTQYAFDFNHVKDLGALNSLHRTAEQTLIARFWSDFSYTVTPPGHWNQIAQNVATNRSSTLADNARLFALLNMAMADSGIVSWDAKYLYNFWRPVTAIQQADTDGNPDTEADPNWLPLLNTPPFPEYVSGHSTFSSSAATILASFYGSDHIPFTAGSDALPGVFRSYTSFAEAADEIGLSRIYGGIHFLSADLHGLAAGHQVGDYVSRNFLRSLRAVLAIAQAPGSDLCQIAVDGISGRSYVLESSSNLVHWTAVHTNTAPFQLAEIVSGSGARFYRAVTAP